MKCDSCGHENREDARFCEDCGEVLPAEAPAGAPSGKPERIGPVCAACGTRNRPGMRFCESCGESLAVAEGQICPACGARNQPGVRFCGQCGESLIRAIEPVIAAPAPPPVAPPAVAQPPVAAPPTATRRALGCVLRTVGTLLVVLVILVAALLLLGSLAASTLIEKNIAGAAWGEVGPGSRLTFAETEIEQSVAEVVQLYLPGSVEDVRLDFAPPDRIVVWGTVFGRNMFLECTLSSADGMIEFKLERLGGIPLYLVGDILSGAVNRGLRTVLEERHLRVEELVVGENSLTITYAGG